MLLLPSIFHGILGMITIIVIGFSLIIIPNVFAEESTWQVIIMKDASIQDSEDAFFPNELPVPNGDYVSWHNDDTVAHSITSGLPKHPDYHGEFFHVGLIEPGENAYVKIQITDNYEAFYYLCEIHPWMTGKIFTSGTITSSAETEFPILTEKESYKNEEPIIVSGQVHEDFWGTDYEILVYNQENQLIKIVEGEFDDNSKYIQNILPSKNWNSGAYKLKMVYALPSKVAITEFDYLKTVTNSQEQIPTWIKEVGEYWCAEQINDNEFLNAIEYLIQKDIIVIKMVNGADQTDQQVPEWVKNNTCWWSDNKITDIDFLSGIEFLVNKGTIIV